MIRKRGELAREEQVNMRGGSGTIVFENMLEANKDEFYGKGRLFSILTVKPGDSLGYHKHEGEMEVYHVLSGKGKYNDNGTETVIEAGDTTITFDGESHGIENNSDEDLVYIALILFAK